MQRAGGEAMLNDLAISFMAAVFALGLGATVGFLIGS
jgi:hypothetical protein